MLIFIAISLRLEGPSSANGTGRVEILYHGYWGTICDNSWSIQDANVACRQLGYQYAVRALSGSLVPDGTGPIWLSYVGCSGSEESLSSCYHSGWGSNYCSHSQDAGVECSSTGKRFKRFLVLPYLFQWVSIRNIAKSASLVVV